MWNLLTSLCFGIRDTLPPLTEMISKKLVTSFVNINLYNKMNKRGKEESTFEVRSISSTQCEELTKIGEFCNRIHSYDELDLSRTIKSLHLSTLVSELSHTTSHNILRSKNVLEACGVVGFLSDSKDKNSLDNFAKCVLKHLIEGCKKWFDQNPQVCIFNTKPDLFPDEDESARDRKLKIWVLRGRGLLETRGYD